MSFIEWFVIQVVAGMVCGFLCGFCGKRVAKWQEKRKMGKLGIEE